MVIMGVLFGEWATAVLSLIPFFLSLFTLIGCDYVRLHFAALNDSGIYFTNPSWFGIGFINHQDYVTNKNSFSWELNATCSNYDDIGKDIFRSSNLSGSLMLTALATIMAVIVFATIIVLVCIKKSCFFGRLFNCTLSLTSAVLQIGAIFHAFASSGGGVCDESKYGNNFYGTYSPFEYPKLTYMKFFSKCTMGATGRIAIAAAILQCFTFIWLCLNAVAAKNKASADTAPVEVQKGRSIPQQVNKDEQKVAFIDDAGAEEPNVIYPASPPQSTDDDIEAGMVDHPPSPESSDITEEFIEGSAVEEIVPLTTVDAPEGEGEEDEKVEEVEEVTKDDGEDVEEVSEDDDGEPKEADNEVDQDQEAEEEEDIFSLHTTDVRKEAEVTVGNVNITSMKSGRF